eukprot:scaffold28850_cov65-Phaeocystis_antarctica.AAC.2
MAVLEKTALAAQELHYGNVSRRRRVAGSTNCAHSGKWEQISQNPTASLRAIVTHYNWRFGLQRQKGARAHVAPTAHERLVGTRPGFHVNNAKQCSLQPSPSTRTGHTWAAKCTTLNGR